MFPQNLYNTKLVKITVFYTVHLFGMELFCEKLQMFGRDLGTPHLLLYLKSQIVCNKGNLKNKS